MIKVILVDDEALALKNLNYVLEQNKDIEVLEMISNPLEALMKIGELKPDAVFLDIEMPVIGGLAMAEEILKVSPDTLIVFVTAYDDYAVKAFEANALDYVLKPANAERMSRTIEKIKERYLAKQSIKAYKKAIKNAYSMLELKFDKVLAWRNNKIFLLNTEQILYMAIIEAEVAIITENEIYKAKGTLNSWEERLVPYGFFRCHKSYLININRIEVICPMFKNTFSIKLQNCKTEIPVSRRYAAKLKEVLKI